MVGMESEGVEEADARNSENRPIPTSASKPHKPQITKALHARSRLEFSEVLTQGGNAFTRVKGAPERSRGTGSAPTRGLPWGSAGATLPAVALGFVAWRRATGAGFIAAVGGDASSPNPSHVPKGLSRARSARRGRASDVARAGRHRAPRIGGDAGRFPGFWRERLPSRSPSGPTVTAGSAPMRALAAGPRAPRCPNSTPGRAPRARLCVIAGRGCQRSGRPDRTQDGPFSVGWAYRVASRVALEGSVRGAPCDTSALVTTGPL